MSQAAIDDIAALLPPLLQTLEALGFVARHLHPPDVGDVLDAIGTPDAALRSARALQRDWPATVADVGARLERASDDALTIFADLRAATSSTGSVAGLLRAFRPLSRAYDALYPLAPGLPAVSRLFLDPTLRDDIDLLARASQSSADGVTGVIHSDSEPGNRGGYSMYVPEYYSADRPWPLVMALHGGSGNGRRFLWNWLPAARSMGAIVVAPTAIGPTWALMGDDPDTPNIAGILDVVRLRWRVDPARLLLTGMSDGGTFCYVSGLTTASPFTHLAPVAATFHPLLAEMADPERLQGLPIHLVHGALDWMFPVEIARNARVALSNAGADVTYDEIDDLSHVYPTEMGVRLLHWFDAMSHASD